MDSTSRTPFTPTKSNLLRDFTTPRKHGLSTKKPKQQVGHGLGRPIYFPGGAPGPAEPVWFLQMDRFIPARSALDVDVASFRLQKENSSAGLSPSKVTRARACLLHQHSLHWTALLR